MIPIRTTFAAGDELRVRSTNCHPELVEDSHYSRFRPRTAGAENLEPPRFSSTPLFVEPSDADTLLG
jgi:hypothetical protein